VEEVKSRVEKREVVTVDSRETRRDRGEYAGRVGEPADPETEFRARERAGMS